MIKQVFMEHLSVESLLDHEDLFVRVVRDRGSTAECNQVINLRKFLFSFPCWGFISCNSVLDVSSGLLILWWRFFPFPPSCFFQIQKKETDLAAAQELDKFVKIPAC